MTDISLQAIGANGLPRVEVAPPPLVPNWFNLYTVADVRDGGCERDPWGTVWEDDPIDAVKATQVLCPQPTNKLPFKETSWALSGDPFVVWAGDCCAPIGRTEADVEAIVRGRLDVGEAYQAAVLGIVPVSGATAPDRIDITGQGALMSLAETEQAMWRRGTQGVIWMSPLIATILGAHNLVRDGDMLRTILGTPVVITDAFFKTEMYGTGPVTVDRGCVEVLSAMNRQTNVRCVIAERVVTVTIAKPWIKATVTPPTP